VKVQDGSHEKRYNKTKNTTEGKGVPEPCGGCSSSDSRLYIRAEDAQRGMLPMLHPCNIQNPLLWTSLFPSSMSAVRTPHQLEHFQRNNCQSSARADMWTATFAHAYLLPKPICDDLDVSMESVVGPFS